MVVNRRYTVAIDFDGVLFTNVDNASIFVGDPIKEGIRLLRNIKELGFSVILWTCREDESLELALSALEKEGIPRDTFDAINENTKEMKDFYGTDPRKIGADLYLDDKALRNFNLENVLKIIGDLNGCSG